LWFKTSTAHGVLLSDQDLPVLQTPNGYNPLIYVENTGKLHGGGWIGSEPSLVTSFTVTDGKWHHAVVTYDGSNVQNLYVDGNFIASQTGVRSSGGGYWAIGTGFCGWSTCTGNVYRYFNGIIDDVRIYNIALSAGEVKQ